MLYVCGTPIGNLADASLRLVETLRAVEVIACEDTRRTLKLLSHFGIAGPRLVSLHEHNEQERVGELLPMLQAGAEVALVSDAGMPVLSDPGLRLVQACRDVGIAVTVVPGPSAPVAALALSGLPSDRVLFTGFLPRTTAGLSEILATAAAARATLVAFESPRRVRATLEVLAALDPTLEVALCRELTKVHEQVLRGAPGELAALLTEPVRGEVVLVLHAAHTARRGSYPSTDVGEDEMRRLVQQMLQNGLSTKDAARELARITGQARGSAYAFVLRTRRDTAADGQGREPV